MTLALSSVLPIAGLLDPDPDVARFTPITADLEVDVGFVPVVYAKLGDPYMWHVVFDGILSAFSPLFDEHSTILTVGQISSLVLLPTGGWWDSPIVLTYGQFQEAT